MISSCANHGRSTRKATQNHGFRKDIQNELVRHRLAQNYWVLDRNCRQNHGFQIENHSGATIFCPKQKGATTISQQKRGVRCHEVTAT